VSVHFKRGYFNHVAERRICWLKLRFRWYPTGSWLTTNKVLRNTYLLLSLTLLFSAFTAGIAVVSHAPPLHWLITLGGLFRLCCSWLPGCETASGALLAVFALTGFLGYTLGPILSVYLALPNGPQLVMTALAGTGAIFLALSGYALVSRKDFSFMGAFLMVGMLVAFLASIGAVLFNHADAVAGGVRDGHSADVWHDPVANQRNYSRRRNQLHHGDRHPVHHDLQPVHEPAANSGRHVRRRLSNCRNTDKPRKSGVFFMFFIPISDESWQEISLDALTGSAKSHSA
jgi:hypothetical protein